MDAEHERESIWSIRKDDLAWYSVLFPLLWVVGAIVYAVTIFSRQLQPAEVIGLLIAGIGLVGLSSAVLSLMILAAKGGVRRIMPLFDWADRREAKLRAEAREAGRQEVNAEWRAWYEQEKANGGTFRHPPPQPDERRDDK